MSFTTLSRTCCVFLALGCPALMQAQTGVTVAGFGYLKPSNTITAAPGQVLAVSVFGVTARLSEPIFPVANNGFPSEVGGVSVDFVQGLMTIQLQIRGVQQNACPTSGTCSPATTVTIEIPYELNPEGDQATLRFKEHGTGFADVALNAVSDSVHVINSCDQTGISLSLASGLPTGTCAPMIMHARGPLVSSTSPATPGETLVLWAYGLGAIDHPIIGDCCVSPEQLPLASQPFMMSFSTPDPARPVLRRLAGAAPIYAGMVGSGVYQVQFVVPAVPSDISRCGLKSGNLKVLLSGPNSADAAEICVKP